MSRINNVTQSCQRGIGGHLETPQADCFKSAVEIGVCDMVCKGIVGLSQSGCEPHANA